MHVLYGIVKRPWFIFNFILQSKRQYTLFSDCLEMMSAFNTFLDHSPLALVLVYFVKPSPTLDPHLDWKKERKFFIKAICTSSFLGIFQYTGAIQ